MKRWEQVLFGVSSLAILLIIGFKLHELDMPTARFVRSFNIGIVNQIGDLMAVAGKGAVLTVLFVLVALVGWWLKHDRLKENVGCQDQVMAAFGGFNRIDFWGERDFRVSPIIMGAERLRLLERHLMLVFTGHARTASLVAAEQISATPHKNRELRVMRQMVDEAIGILTGGGDLSDFGSLLHENWQLKRSLSDSISTPLVDEIYASARAAGCLGGKLLGAGGGGFLLLFARPEDQPRVTNALKSLLHVPFEFESVGTHIIFYDREHRWR